MREQKEKSPVVHASGPHTALAMLSGALAALVTVMQYQQVLQASTLDSIRKIETGMLTAVSGVVSDLYTPISDTDEVADIVVKLMVLHDAIAAILGEDRFEAAIQARSPKSFGFASSSGASQ